MIRPNKAQLSSENLNYFFFIFISISFFLSSIRSGQIFGWPNIWQIGNFFRKFVEKKVNRLFPNIRSSPLINWSWLITEDHNLGKYLEIMISVNYLDSRKNSCTAKKMFFVVLIHKRSTLISLMSFGSAHIWIIRN